MSTPELLIHTGTPGAMPHYNHVLWVCMSSLHHYATKILKVSCLPEEYLYVDMLTCWGLKKKKPHLFVHDIFKCIFVNENSWLLIKISVRCVPSDPIDNDWQWQLTMTIDNDSTLVQVMTWHQIDNKPYMNHCWPRSLMSYGISWPNVLYIFAFRGMMINLVVKSLFVIRI